VLGPAVLVPARFCPVIWKGILLFRLRSFREGFFGVDGDEVEINLYSPGKKAGKRITILGECKWRIYRREVRSFVRQVEKVRGFGE